MLRESFIRPSLNIVELKVQNSKVRSSVKLVVWLLGFLQEGFTQVWASGWATRGILSQQAEKGMSVCWY